MVAAMGLPGGGRAVISARLQSAANNLCFASCQHFSNAAGVLQATASYKGV